MDQNTSMHCPHCGAAVSGGDLFCVECGEKILPRQSPKDTPPETEDKPKERIPYPGEIENLTGKLKRWRLLFAIIVPILSILTLVFFAQMISARDDADRMERKYENWRDDYYDLEEAYDACQKLLEYNGLVDLYQVQFESAYNSDSNGEIIGKTLDIDTLDCLRIDIDITSQKKDARWADPLTVKLIKSGEVIHQWTIDPSDTEASKETVGWMMWTGSVAEEGTYLVEFYHKGWIVDQDEFVIK